MEEQTGDATSEERVDPGPANRRQLPGWLRGSTRAVLAVIFAAGSLISFVAAAGGAIVWVRFYAAKLPADQALAALPRGELIASGAVLLAIFVLLGIVAVVGVYMFDADEYQPRGMLRGLLALVTAECALVVGLAVSVEWERRLVAVEGILLFGLLLLLVIRWRERLLLPQAERERGESHRRKVTFVIAGITVVAFMAVGVMRLHDVPWHWHAGVLGATLLVVSNAIAFRWIKDGFSKLEVGASEQEPKSPPSDDNEQTERRRRWGKLGIITLTAASLTFSSLVMWEAWIAVTLLTAVVLGVASWRVAVRTRYDLFVCGVAVFVSVPLIGAVAGVARNLADPQVQPVALIRKDDGVAEALQGIYVTETDDRVYFATVATKGCSGDVEPASGRMLWVPREDVVAMALGPPQSVDDAGEHAREMYYALAPAADPYAPPGFTARKRPLGRLAKGERRLEDLGPVLRRHFDVGSEVNLKASDNGYDVTVSHSEDEAPDGEEIVRVGSRELKDDSVSWDGKTRTLRFHAPEHMAGRVSVDCGVAPPPILDARGGVPR